jgi:hypothetical protein
VFLRGNPGTPGTNAPRRFLEIGTRGERALFPTNASGRLELAQAIVSRDNPLTARVFVNRVWGQFFGKPVVPTPSNFGHSGMPATHPALLDDLAVRFMQGGWSVKSLARELVLSATYRQSSRDDAKRSAMDAANESLWRMNRRRLTIEQWRDAVLAVTGELTPAPGKSREVSDPANHHRTVYARVSRLKLDDLLMQFDYPDANVHAERRSTTTTPTQKLFLLNSPFVLERAKVFAANLEKEIPGGGKPRIERAYQLLYGRAPRNAEVKAALDFLERPTSSEMPRWEQYVQMLFVANEMLYVD